MRNSFRFTILAVVLAFLVACGTSPSSTFTITGHYIEVESETEIDSSVEESTDYQEVDLSTATVVVTHEVSDANGNTDLVELTSGKFADGLVTLEGEINEPTEVEISVQIGDGVRLSTSALLVPDGEVVEFALVDYADVYPEDQLILYGASRRAKDPETKFTVYGDVSGVKMKDLSLAIASVDTSEYDENGSLQRVPYGSVLIRDNKFVIESDITEVSSLSISVEAGWAFRSYTPAIIGPKSAVTVVSDGAPNTLMASSENARHVKLIESWQQSEEYLENLEKYVATWEAKERAAQTPPSDIEVVQKDLDDEQDTSSDDGEETQESADTEQTQNDTESVELNDSEASDGESDDVAEISTPRTAEGCEHVPIEDVIPGLSPFMSASGGFQYPDWVVSRQVLEKMRSDAIDELATNSTDPLNTLLALELGAFAGINREDTHLALPLYDKIATTLDDEDLVERRVIRPRNELARRLAVKRNDELLQPGQKAPKFTLPDLNGNEFALDDVLKRNEVVYIDFWASWCGPCIATFPALREIYSDFNNNGFEILMISIDDTFEEWEEASDEHKLAWINVADIGGFNQETPVAYGVQGIPKAFLVDSKGCILQRELSTDNLKEVLVSRFGIASESSVD